MDTNLSSGGRFIGRNGRLFNVLAAVLIAAHAAFSIAGGPHRLTFLSGGSDAPAYLLLASNLLEHRGYTYAGYPTALRPPGYPLWLAGLGLLFERWYIFAARFAQFFFCIGTAWLCGRTAKEIFGARAGYASFLVALLLPTQIFASAQILTECLASFFVALFLCCLVREVKRPAVQTELGMGIAAGAATLLHANCAALPLFAGLAIWGYPRKKLWVAIAFSMVLPLVLVSPWLARNLIVFNGQALFSTQGGLNALQGVLTSDGRTQIGDTEKVRSAVGWWMSEVETNGPTRLRLPSEAVLNQQCWRVVPGLWKNLGWHAVPLLGKKLADFWLSTDQIFRTDSFSRPERLIRLSGVVLYWCTLALAILAWPLVLRSQPRLAKILLAYAAIYTVLHLPLVMNTRIRFPLMDPMVATLAGAGLLRLVTKKAAAFGQQGIDIPETNGFQTVS
jgi:4-amino-4-deoxy-L-arabinose transferase-like glycosyltransferase